MQTAEESMAHLLRSPSDYHSLAYAPDEHTCWGTTVHCVVVSTTSGLVPKAFVRTMTPSTRCRAPRCHVYSSEHLIFLLRELYLYFVQEPKAPSLFPVGDILRREASELLQFHSFLKWDRGTRVY
ncbi:hypothetical protein H6P81_000377 [Aristolochia fimbriata]|uniref:Uncharacterized protein n=1 Tax=Aristolochia fimbriata TaxID=158543 RepID=A0AAV7F584_ARIFI|nr:hypothetical protein H6P81_000377 [Aristolochia fimbriata]